MTLKRNPKGANIQKSIENSKKGSNFKATSSSDKPHLTETNSDQRVESEKSSKSNSGLVDKKVTKHILPNFCYVVQPSGENDGYDNGKIEHDFIYSEIILPSIRSAFDNVNIERLKENHMVRTDDLSNLAKAEVCIFDITGLNHRIIFELGIRLALRSKVTIIMTQDVNNVPFELLKFRCLVYNPHFFGIHDARVSLSHMLKEAFINPKNDSIVFDLIPNLQVDYGTTASGFGVMPWSYYWRKLSDISQRMIQPKTPKPYLPDVFIAISNGGMMFADLLVHVNQDFKKIPIWSLWARRQTDNISAEFFDVKPNKYLLQSIMEYHCENNSNKPVPILNVLIVDDIVSTGSTSKQAIQLVTSEYGDKADVRFLSLFNENLSTIPKKHILWYHEIFGYHEKDLQELYKTDYYVLPYFKHIRK